MKVQTPQSYVWFQGNLPQLGPTQDPSGVTHPGKRDGGCSLLWGETVGMLCVPVFVDGSDLCAPRISWVSPSESWEVRVSFSASSARTSASSLPLISLCVFPTREFLARLLPLGTGPKLPCSREWERCLAREEARGSEGKHRT